jgi:ribosomal protein L34E
MGLTIAQLSERLRCADCGSQLHSVKPWRMEDALGKPVGRRA